MEMHCLHCATIFPFLSSVGCPGALALLRTPYILTQDRGDLLDLFSCNTFYQKLRPVFTGMDIVLMDKVRG